MSFTEAYCRADAAEYRRRLRAARARRIDRAVTIASNTGVEDLAIDALAARLADQFASAHRSESRPERPTTEDAEREAYDAANEQDRFDGGRLS